MSMNETLEWCQVLVFQESDNNLGPRIGGKRPHNVRPRVVLPHTRYLLTLPWVGGEEVSLFTSVTDQTGQYCTWNYTKQWHNETCPLVQAVRHPVSHRSRTSDCQSLLSGKAVTLKGSKDITGRSEINKQGGQAYFHNQEEDLIHMSQQLFADGFIHVVQLFMPPVSGTWPFGEETFQLFARQVGSELSVRYVWG